MKWSWKLGRFAGIDVYIHATFLLLLGFYGVRYWANGGMSAMIEGIIFILVLFGCVVLHEYGHALMARVYGIPTRDITLYPIGGVARLERMPEKPRQEFWVALAGPAVNIAIATILGLWLWFTNTFVPFSTLGLTTGSFLERLMLVNISLVVFNLIPAFPMDGGRVLRALLATRLDYVRATKWAATLGQGLAFLFGFVGLFTAPTLIFIAFFIWIAAGQEAGMVQMKAALTGVPVSRAMLTDFRTLHPLEPISHVVPWLVSGAQHDFPVVDRGQLVGILPHEALLAAMRDGNSYLTVGHVMRRDFEWVDANDLLETAMSRLSYSSLQAAPVNWRGQLVGLLTLENVRKFMMVQNMLRASRM
ncbi:MAG: site-2 protease family protein [Anaerolineales bacterium]|nr:site-2 protease family protein [Anaerolineales bacterium]